MEKNIAAETFARLWPTDRYVATVEQLHKAGLGDKHVADGVRLGLLYRVRRGVHSPMNRWRSQPQWAKAKIALAGHIAASKGQLVYTHFSAARLRQLQVWDCPDTVHVNGRYQSSPSKTAADVTVHCLGLAPDEVIQQHVPGVGTARFTGLARTVLDCAMAAPSAHSVLIGDSALHHSMQLAELEAVMLVTPRRKGLKKARRVIEALNGLSESAGESRTRLVIRGLPIEQPEFQITLVVDGEEYRPDFAWREIKLILEFDGDTNYFFFMPTAEALVKERERENALVEEGWRFIRVKWRHLDIPELLKMRIVTAFNAAVLARAA